MLVAHRWLPGHWLARIMVLILPLHLRRRDLLARYAKDKAIQARVLLLLELTKVVVRHCCRRLLCAIHRLRLCR